MEYCDTNLADYQRDNPPPPAVERSALLSKVRQGMGALHDAGILHCDLKSENVLIKFCADGTPEPRLADFGCSPILQEVGGKKKYWVGGTPV
jgi:serine/threonine protein kinase